MPDAPQPDKPPHDDDHPDGLKTLERSAASVLGLIGVGVGGAGIFLSDNQAGTTAILLIGAVFLLMGVQGTAIIKAGKDSVELTKRRASRKLLDKAEEKADEGETETAVEIAAAAREIDPSIKRNRAYRELNYNLYEQMAIHAVMNAASRVINNSEVGRYDSIDMRTEQFIENLDYDAVVRFVGRDQRRVIGVDIVTGRAPVMTTVSLVTRVRKFRDQSIPAIIIYNKPLLIDSEAEQRFFAAEIDDVPNIAVAEWRDQSQDSNLEQALLKLLRVPPQPEQAP